MNHEFNGNVPNSLINQRHRLWFPSSSDNFSMAELRTPPPKVPTVIDPIIAEGGTAILTGAGGSSKTGLIANMAVSIALGRPFFDMPTKRGRILYLTGEDRRADFLRHIYVCCEGLSDAELAAVSSGIVVKDARGLGFKMTQKTNSGATTIAEENLSQMAGFANGIPELRLIAVDTLSRFNGADETNEGMAVFISAMEYLARATNAAVLASHHTGKEQARKSMADQYASRGGSSLSDNSRSVLHIARVTSKTKRIGDKYYSAVPEGAEELVDQKRLLRLRHVKVNLLLPAADVWIEKEITPHAARLRKFQAVESIANEISAWPAIRDWLKDRIEIDPYPTSRTLADAAGTLFGSRNSFRRSIQWALANGHLDERDHPHPHASRKTYLALPSASSGQ